MDPKLENDAQTSRLPEKVEPEKVETDLQDDQTVLDSPRRSDEIALISNDQMLDPVYAAKASLLNDALQDIGMGKYQWQLFILVAFGWASDNSWLIVTSLIFTPVANEFGPSRPTLLTLSQNIGLCLGAAFWGFGCDLIGRRWAFNMTLGIASVFGLIGAGAPTFAGICVLDGLWSFGVGGNLPVDSAVFLEFLPGSHQYLLVVLSTFWALAQLVANLIAWPLLGNLTCQQGQATCTRSENMGWRYYLIVMGGLAMLMFIARFFCFDLQEPPKYLMGKGRDAEAVAVIHKVAAKNGKESTLTLEDLQACEKLRVDDTMGKKLMKEGDAEKLDLSHVKALFASRKLAFSTSLLIVIWGLIGLGFPLYNAFLPYIQATRGVEFGDGSTKTTYLYTTYIALAGIPGALVGAGLVELKGLGRKGCLCISTILTGVFLFASTTATSSKALLGWNCAYNFASNVMYAVLYAQTPETFPTMHRGTGNALVSTANRVMGILAPIVAMYADLDQSATIVYVAASMFLGAGFLALALPFETRGRTSM